MDVQDLVHDASAVTEGQSSAIKDITFGSIAGMASKLFEHPFDLVKVRLQSQPTDRPPTFAGPLDCFRQTWGREGWRGLYRGVSAPLVGAACENACLFLTYNKFQDIILNIRPTIGGGPGSVDGKSRRRDLTLGELALAAGAAGAAASFLLTPIELVKCRMQVQRLAQEGIFGAAPPASAPLAGSSTRAYSTAAVKPKLQGPFAIVRSTIAAHGLKGLWLGQTGTLFRETGGSAAWFGAYEAVSRAFISVKQKQADARGAATKITKKDLSTLELMAAGACAGMSYNIVLFPADCVKSAMQTEEELRPRQRGPDGKFIGQGPKFWSVAKRIYTSRGIAGLYAGCGVTVARAAPSSAMIFLIYESLESRFGSYF
ncbi:mitochondrial ornithine carrier protein [Naganishia albida]|nr:mitochondrial ornithine carrier protein [Naganishia albida]